MQRDRFEIGTWPSLDTIGQDSASYPIRVCIVTEEIIGPVRNGGIASTYYHLARGLAAQGHEVHVLYLKGRKVQDATPEHWVEHYASFGVALHYLDVPPEPLTGPALFWQARFLAAYRWLKEQPPFDVIHTSEWRGGAVYALMAKRLGLAFADTLFLVKTSSPYLWNRHYQMQGIEKDDLLAVSHAEQKCVELADMVIGGSAHLITFMDHVGYRLPPGNVFVQPNIVDFSNVPVTDLRPAREYGDVMQTRELVFFGRLEARKGIEVFCNAVDVLHDRGAVPDKITFLGKWGGALESQGKMPVQTFLETRAARWTCEIEIVTDKNQPEALSHMCSRDMIAVMPSLIENSTMAVYEALEMKIPFIATRVGGTAELIHEDDHAATLVPPEALALADRMQAVLAEGQIVARPSFSNEANLRTWYGFHNHVGRRIAEAGRAAAAAELARPVAPPPVALATAGIAVLLRPEAETAPLVERLRAAAPDQVVLAVNDPGLRTEATEAVAALQAAGVAATLRDGVGLSAGAALSAAVEALETDVLVAADGTGARPRPGYFTAARTGLSHRPQALFGTLYQGEDGLGLPLGGDVATLTRRGQPYGPELVAFTRATWDRLGPFEPYDVACGLIHEFITRAAVAGPDDLLIYPEALLDWPGARDAQAGMAKNPVYAYLKSKPLIDGAALGTRKVLLDAVGHSRAAGLSPALMRDGGRPPEAPLWLVPADWPMEDFEAGRGRRLLIAVDPDSRQMWFYARGPGARQLRIGDLPQQVSLRDRRLTPGGDEITLSVYEMPEDMEPQSSLALIWGLEEDGEAPRERLVRVNSLGDGVFQVACRQPLLSRAALMRLVDIQTGRGPRPAPAPEAPKAPSGAAPLPARALRHAGQPPKTPVWMMPVGWAPDNHRLARGHQLAVGLDGPKQTLYLYAQGLGERRLLLDGTPCEITSLHHLHSAGPGKEPVSLASFRVPNALKPGRSYSFNWQLHEPHADKPRQRIFRVTKLQDRTYALVCRQPILSRPALLRLMQEKTRIPMGAPSRATRARRRLGHLLRRLADRLDRR